jgi:hypothetical protein
MGRLRNAARFSCGSFTSFRRCPPQVSFTPKTRHQRQSLKWMRCATTGSERERRLRLRLGQSFAIAFELFVKTEAALGDILKTKASH